MIIILKSILLPLHYCPSADSFFAGSDDEENFVDLQSPNFVLKPENSEKSDEDEENTPDRRNDGNNNGPTPPSRKKGRGCREEKEKTRG